MAITTVSTTAGLVSALKAAADGDTIQLGSGTYSAVSLKDLSFANGVTITSQTPGAPAVITDMTLSGTRGLTFQDLEFAARFGDGISYRVESCQNLVFQRLDVHGSLDRNPSNDGLGFLIRNSANVTVRDSEFRELDSGISHLNDEHLKIVGNSFHDLQMDGVRGGGSSWVTISGNRFRDFFREATTHADAVQFWTSGVTTTAHDIVVSNNSVVRGDGLYIQGIFFGDESGVGYDHVAISGNLVVGEAIAGISVTGAHDVTVTDNIVQGFLDRKSYIKLIDSDVGIAANNFSSLVNLLESGNIQTYGNTTIGQADDDGAWAIQLWQSRQGQPPAVGLRLVGDAGDNTLTGGDLADTLAGGTGNDLLTGGGGDDVFVVDDKLRIVETANGGIDTVRSSIGFSLPANVEVLELTGARASTGNGNALDNVVTGNGAANLLRGRAGADTLSGGAGGDTLYGEAGADILTGGAGADRFSFGPGDGRDVIRDFGAGAEHDLIDVSALRAAGATSTLAQAGADVTITFSTGEQIVVQDTLVAELRAHASGWMF
ncbi:MAG: right-handed parallel beta-helix repeat-containing protein [Phenylobacterium sp.]|uniref:calcium-binding protein n=1 Tax=Phenylobacterium sp. TaxID=1871053 RepID=UPI001A5E1F3D|nr:right-handed parallel beta-helix repeat-containing protein [Phenylobacterium sp.]MBL8553962.1 right-handed parallel beta-helix repeat-containing protein [Phenylobacterium sp.]